MSATSALLSRLDTLSLPSTLEATVAALYARPPRAYHSFEHVLEVAAWFEEVEAAIGWRQPREVMAAVLFHDAIYEAGRADNEQRSAELARTELAALAPRLDLDRVARLILFTARHGRLGGEELDDDAALFLDCDMAILGAEPERFDRYERAIAEEYRAVPREVYTAGRAHFLRRLLEAPRIFHSAHFHARLDVAARSNLARALAAG